MTEFTWMERTVAVRFLDKGIYYNRKPASQVFPAVAIPLLTTQLSGFTIIRAKWVIQWRFVLFEPLRAPYISA